jgi:nitrogen fixation NifU-like protein
MEGGPDWPRTNPTYSSGPRGMPIDDELYQERILDHYEEPFHRGPCPAATHAHEDENPLCGDMVRVELAIDPDGTIRDAYFNGDGCCISQASASMLIERVNGRPVEEVKAFSGQDMLQLFGAKLTPNRQKCCLLAWRALQSAFYSPLAGRADERLPG